MLVGDLLAYLDIFTLIFLLGIVSRAATILYMLKQAVAQAVRLGKSLRAGATRLDFRHRREGGEGREGSARGPSSEDNWAPVHGVAWA